MVGIRAGTLAMSSTECTTAFTPYSAAVLTSIADIRRVQPLVSRALPRTDILFDPEFFLASLTKQWRPLVVAVHQGDELARILYAKERLVLGRRLGVAYADLSFWEHTAGNTIQQRDTFRTAVETALAFPAIHGLRLKVPRASPEMAAVRQLVASQCWDVHFARARDHAVLRLPDTYEELLESFGSTTRRNFRYYRRRFEAASHDYLENLSMEEMRSAAFYLAPRSARPAKLASVARGLAMAAAADRPLLAGLRHKNGE